MLCGERMSWGMERGKADCPARRRWLLPMPLRWARLRALTSNFVNLSGAVTGAGGQPRRTIVTWFILPVVICLSQRLSHACLSISNYTAKLRMAHYISYRLFDNTLLLG